MALLAGWAHEHTPPGRGPRTDAEQDPQRFVVVTQDGMGVAGQVEDEDGATAPSPSWSSSRPR